MMNSIHVRGRAYGAIRRQGGAPPVARRLVVVEVYRMAGDVDYVLKIIVADMATYDAFYTLLIESVPSKNVSSRFAMERITSTTALQLHE